MLEERIQRSFDSITPAQLTSLVNVYNSLKDGMGRVEDFFTVPAVAGGTATTLAEKAKAAAQESK